jgi:hypothetical protein
MSFEPLNAASVFRRRTAGYTTYRLSEIAYTLTAELRSYAGVNRVSTSVFGIGYSVLVDTVHVSLLI